MSQKMNPFTSCMFLRWQKATEQDEFRFVTRNGL